MSRFTAIAARALPGGLCSALLGLLLLPLAGCEQESEGTPSINTSAEKERPPIDLPPLTGAEGGSGASTSAPPSVFRFADVAKESGVGFVHVSGMTDERHFPTANGSGVAIFDYDGDGRMDLYFASNCYLPAGSRPEGQNRLYRNLGDLKFEDVTEKSGLGYKGFCHGIVVGDFDGDRDSDVFLATYHQNTFYVNNGDGTFREAGREAGVAPAGFYGRIEGGGDSDEPLVVDAVAGLKWRVGGGEPTDRLILKVKKGQKLVFRQADPEAPRGLELLADPGLFETIPEKADGVSGSGGESALRGSAVLREVGAERSRLYRAVPPVAAGGEPAVMAEFEVVGDLKKPIGFECSEHRTAWSSGGAVIDYDDDGDLDLYVTNYGWWTVEDHGDKFCGNVQRGVRQYCSPKEVTTVRHILYRNDGVKDGIPRFTDVTDEVGVNRSDGHGFGAVTADLDGDGKIDLYVANDQNPAFTYLNEGDGTFRDVTDLSGAGYDEKGATQSGMGVDATDVDGDGQPELFRTNFSSEYNTLYHNLGGGTFYDQTAAYGLAPDAMPWVGWGCALADFDNDGWPDAFVANGHVDNNYHLLGIDNVPYEEPPLLHRNVPVSDGPGASRKFVLATRGAGPYFESPHVGRGAAFGDLDDDGDLDIVVNHKDGTPAILRNDTPANGNRWLRLRLRGTKSNPDAVGARVQVVANGRTLYRQVKGGYSLESSNDPRLLIGVGPAERLETVIVQWPSGGPDSTLKDVETNRGIAIDEAAP
jgi:hypothetical protein